MATPIITDGSLDRVRKTPRVVLPMRPDIFADRAARFASVAAGNAMSGYLQLMAKVAQAQQSTLAKPHGRSCAGSCDDGESRVRNATAIGAVARPFAAMACGSSRYRAATCARNRPMVCRPRLRRSMRLTKRRRNRWPIVCWRVHRSTTKLRSCHSLVRRCKPISRGSLRRLNVALVEHCDIPGICPVCASRPVASVLRIGGEQANLRYLVCSLCATEWNMSRIQCTSCDTDKGVKYLVLQAEGDSKDRDRSARRDLR